MRVNENLYSHMFYALPSLLPKIKLTKLSHIHDFETFMDDSAFCETVHQHRTQSLQDKKSSHSNGNNLSRLIVTKAAKLNIFRSN